MKIEQLAAVTCTLGALLVVIGLGVQYLVVPRMPVESTWSREDAEAHTAASMKYHNQSFDPRISEAELAATAAEFEEISQKLEAAKNRRSRLPKYFQFGGYLLIGIGVASHIAHKVRSES